VDSRLKRAGMTIEQKTCSIERKERSIQQFAKAANCKASDRKNGMNGFIAVFLVFPSVIISQKDHQSS